MLIEQLKRGTGSAASVPRAAHGSRDVLPDHLGRRHRLRLPAQRVCKSALGPCLADENMTSAPRLYDSILTRQADFAKPCSGVKHVSDSSMTSAARRLVFARLLTGDIMLRSYRLALTVGFLALAALPARAEQMQSPQQVFTPKNTATHVGEFYSIFPDCRLAPQDDFRVVMAPKHGRLSKV